MPVRQAAIITIITVTTKITIMDNEPDVLRGERLGHRGADEAQAPLGVPEIDAGQSSDAAARLLVWLSPAFPVGSFAFSHGLEWAVHESRVHDAESTIGWLDGLVEHGALRNDAIFAACAWRATIAQEADALCSICELALAMAGSRERYLESTAQGNAFVAIVREAWPTLAFGWATRTLEGDIAYPVAVGMTSAAHDIALSDMLKSYTLSLIQNLVSATIRLSVIGHTDGQRAIAALLPAVGNLAKFATSAMLDDVGGAAFQSDIASLQHETQYSRLFRS
jgi:urease accessory protein